MCYSTFSATQDYLTGLDHCKISVGHPEVAQIAEEESKKVDKHLAKLASEQARYCSLHGKQNNIVSKFLALGPSLSLSLTHTCDL